MSQVAGILSGHVAVQVELPDAMSEVMPGVAWGAVEAFPTPAYWAYQVLARRVIGTTIRHRLGHNLQEEVAACLLGGHGIPAEVGLAAFARLRDHGALNGDVTVAEMTKQLLEPLQVGSRSIRYRFAAQKARYVHAAMRRLSTERAPMASGRQLRDWLTELPGIGLKTASWVARNTLDADDVAILDIHILRAGALAGFFDPELTVERHYRALEERFIEFSRCLQVRPSELDSAIWMEMKMSPASVSRLLDGRRGGVMTARIRSTRAARPAKEGRANADQASIFK
jgi:thermostable 8-oxoguanine DNA glycosylase